MAFLRDFRILVKQFETTTEDRILTQILSMDVKLHPEPPVKFLLHLLKRAVVDLFLTPMLPCCSAATIEVPKTT